MAMKYRKARKPCDFRTNKWCVFVSMNAYKNKQVQNIVKYEEFTQMPQREGYVSSRNVVVENEAKNWL